MRAVKRRKDTKKALLLSLCPGLGFLYLEKIIYWILFAAICIMPLMLIKSMGSFALIVFGLLYGLSIYYTYVLANETLKNSEVYKKDPYYILCLSVLLDGLGQFFLKQHKKAYLMMCTGLTPCIITWIGFIIKYGFMDMILATKESSLYMITNIMVVWLIIAIPIKFLSLVDAYYSTYHLYIAKK